MVKSLWVTVRAGTSTLAAMESHWRNKQKEERIQLGFQVIMWLLFGCKLEACKEGC